MLKKMAFANSLAAVCGLMYIAVLVLASAAPTVYEYLLKAQFLGAEVSAPAQLSFDLGLLITFAVMGWVTGYVWAWFYNLWA